mmetsp:Transcript_40229/g.87708  ORF Transcript_40229/g.87708 Transcript_40229/m.87708 type:complete len:303 (-) Transcript_40229:167-1075(-)
MASGGGGGGLGRRWRGDLAAARAHGPAGEEEGRLRPRALRAAGGQGRGHGRGGRARPVHGRRQREGPLRSAQELRLRAGRRLPGERDPRLPEQDPRRDESHVRPRLVRGGDRVGGLLQDWGVPDHEPGPGAPLPGQAARLHRRGGSEEGGDAVRGGSDGHQLRPQPPRLGGVVDGQGRRRRPLHERGQRGAQRLLRQRGQARPPREQRVRLEHRAGLRAGPAEAHRDVLRKPAGQGRARRPPSAGGRHHAIGRCEHRAHPRPAGDVLGRQDGVVDAPLAGEPDLGAPDVHRHAADGGEAGQH